MEQGLILTRDHVGTEPRNGEGPGIALEQRRRINITCCKPIAPELAFQR